MKKVLIWFLVSALILTGCAQNNLASCGQTQSEVQKEEKGSRTEEIPGLTIEAEENQSETLDLASNTDDSDKVNGFYSLNDPQLLQYLEDSVYTGLIDQYQSEDYIIENVNAVYISEDYLEEAEYNSKTNIFFGYTLDELDKQFKGTPYVFTLGEDGKTTVHPFEDYDDTYDQIIKNVAIGTGVILICVTVSVVTGGVGAGPVSMVFATAAKTGTAVAVSSGTFSAIFAGAVTGIQTKNFDQVIKAAALQGSNGFKWGAITGALTGGIGEASELRNASSAGQTLTNGAPKWRQAEERAVKKYGGEEQISYFEGNELPFGTPGATRPDVVRWSNNHREAIEVKYYDLSNPSSRSTLYRELEREVSDRVINLPEGSTQRIVLDVTGRGFSKELVQEVKATIQMRLSSIYQDIPVDIVGL